MTGFFDHAVADPDRRALVGPDGRVHSYGELAGAVHAATHGLRAEGLVAGDTVAVLARNAVETAVLYGAAVQAGLTFVAVNWHLTAAEVAVILDDAGAGALVVDDPSAAAGHAAAATAGIVPERVFGTGREGSRRFADLTTHPRTPPPDRAAGVVMFYTSGTTGRPKGVRKILDPVPPDEIDLSTGIGLHARRAAAADAPTDAVHLVGGPLYHAAPLAALAMALDDGATVVLMDRWTPERFLELVEEHGVTHASMVPTMFHRLLSLPTEVREAADVSSLEAVSHAGAPCPIDVKWRMLDWFGPIITESYSATEGAGTSVTADEWMQRPGTVGRPSGGTEVVVLDDDGNRCPPGVAGRVFLSQSLWRFEYLHDPAKTEATRRDDRFTVGDIGYLDDDGYLFLCDRDSEVIVSGGVNIYPAEVESVLLGHDAVGDVAVIGVPDDEWGEQVRAVVQPAVGRAATPELGTELVAWCRGRLAHFKCPRHVDFVDDLGRDPNGKLRKEPIRARYWQGRDRRI